MTDRIRAEAGCLLIGEYVDEGDSPSNLAAHRSEVVRPHVVAKHLDVWGKEEAHIREFTVLLKDGRMLSVQGHGIKQFPLPSSDGDNSAYGIIIRTGGEEVLVGLFKVFEVVGIFNGEVLTDRKSA